MAKIFQSRMAQNGQKLRKKMADCALNGMKLPKVAQCGLKWLTNRGGGRKCCFLGGFFVFLCFGKICGFFFVFFSPGHVWFSVGEFFWPPEILHFSPDFPMKPKILLFFLSFLQFAFFCAFLCRILRINVAFPPLAHWTWPKTVLCQENCTYF